METKFTEGDWEVVEHSWSDTSIVCGDKTIATISIYDEATEETQEVLEIEATANAKLIRAAPDLLESVLSLLSTLKSTYPSFQDWVEYKQAIKAIKKATE